MIDHDFPYLDTRDINLDWLLKNMKLIIKQWADYQSEMNEQFSNLETAFNTLKDWIDSYFDNLDVQQEINNKLDAMKTSGELGEIMQPIISDETAAWLAAHITQPTTPVIDSSLTVEGAAADAKATGDKISEVKSALRSTQEGDALIFLMPHNLMVFNQVDGHYINYETGKIGVNASYSYMIIPCFGVNAYQPTGFSVNSHIAFFDKDENYISGILWRNGIIRTPQNCAYMSVSMTTANFSDAVLYDTSLLNKNDTDSDLKQIRNLRPDYEFFSEYIVHGKNYFDKYHVVEGAFIDYTFKGSINANADYCYCPTFMPVSPSTTYVPNGQCLVSEFDADKNWILCHNMTTFPAVAPFTTDAACSYIRISVRIAHKDLFMLEEGSSATTYEPFKMAFIGEHSAESTPQYIIVAADGSGDFTTIADAFNAANAGDTIYIKDGLYTESLKMNDKRVHLVGESKEKTIIEYLNTSYANPPVEIAQGSLENLTLHASTAEGQTGAYCLHCDAASSANGYLYVRNVKFINDNYQAVGIGLEPNFTLTLEDCEIYGQLYCHDCAREFSDLTGQVLRVINSTIYTKGEALGAIRMQSQERTGAKATAVFQRCIVKNPGGQKLVYMGLWPGGETLARDGWLGSTDWALDAISDLNNAAILSAT